MLALPTDGLRTSVERHNSDLNVATDWLELLALISTAGEWSQYNVGDILAEGDIYRDQGFAAEFIESMWAELQRRSAGIATAHPLFVELDRVVRRADVPYTALLFCLLLSVGPRYSGWATQFGGNYVEQGDLFERLVADALRFWFPSWDVVRTGWGDGNQMPLENFVEMIAMATFEEQVTGWGAWVPAQAKDIGVDVAVVRRFGDGGGGLPVMMWQCASGQNWSTKLSTPNTKTWARVITFTHTPLRGLATPVVIPLEQFTSRRNQAHGVLLDRYRLLPREQEGAWLEAETAGAISAWCDQRLAWLFDNYPLAG